MITPTLTNCTFTISDFEQVKEKVLNWANRFDTFCFLDNQQYRSEPHSVECLLAAGVRRYVIADAGHALEKLQELISETSRSVGPRLTGSWIFGHLGYDLKNEIEKLSSSHPDRIGFPGLYFFEPEIMIRFNEKEMNIDAEDPGKIFAAISSQVLPVSPVRKTFDIQSRISKEEYIRIIEQLKEHIHRGDCYEINFCQEFFAENARIDPVAVYKKLSFFSPNPFSALYRLNNRWLICASPERFVKKQGNKILSQPIKGTSKREKDDEQKDRLSKEGLLNSAKDRSENVMVVDLVRNDLAKVCKEGTVRVDELFGIYSFPQVHQMISTISGELKQDVLFRDIMTAVFPMGSMTGAPKKRVMELIEQYEKTKRGIFSGAVGYITPGGDFDFNVVIRSILYNESAEYLSFLAGSGITFYSDPEKEWDECLLKAEAMKKALDL